MALLSTGDENAGQEMSVPVPGRPTPLRVRTLPGNEVAFNPLTTVLFADSGTTTPAASQNGSIATPFSTVDAAAAVAADGDTIEVTPGTYSTTLTGRALAFVGMGAKRANSSPSIVFSVVALTSSSASFADCDLTLDCSDTDLTAYRCALFGEFDGTGSLFALESTWSSLDGIPFIRASLCHAGELTDCGDVELYDCAIEGDMTCTGTLTIQNARNVQPNLTLTATSIVVDADSLRALVFAGTTFVGAVTGYSGTILTWGAGVATSGQWLNVGTRANPATDTDENDVSFFASRPGVLCLLTAFAPVETTVTVRINQVDTPLTVTVDNAIGFDTTTFVPCLSGVARISVGVTGTAGANCLVAATYV